MTLRPTNHVLVTSEREQLFRREDAWWMTCGATFVAVSDNVVIVKGSVVICAMMNSIGNLELRLYNCGNRKDSTTPKAMYNNRISNNLVK